MKQLPHRKSPRLKDYDYSQSGAYFVTICTYKKQHIFGHINGDIMHLNQMGKIAHKAIKAIPTFWATVDIDLFIIMPNHIHIIVLLTDDPQKSSSPKLGQIIGNYKSGVTRSIREALKKTKFAVWQTRFHDHIIRNETDLNRLREYTIHNPSKWTEDTFHG